LRVKSLALLHPVLALMLLALLTSLIFSFERDILCNRRSSNPNIVSRPCYAMLDNVMRHLKNFVVYDL
jgi:hypothetical protein